MKNLSLSEVKVVSGGITNEVFLATVTVFTFSLLVATIAANSPHPHVVGYEYGYYDSYWYVPSYSYYSPGYYHGYYW